MTTPSSDGSSNPHAATSSRSAKVGWIAAAVLLVAAAGAGVYAANLRLQLQDVELRLVDAVTKLQDSQERLVGAAGQLDAFRTNLGLIGASGVNEVKLSARGNSSKAGGRAFVGDKGMLISASGLPPMGDDRAYQVWLLGKGAPVNAGSMHPDPQGNATAAFDVPADAPAPVTGIQLTAEPAEGSSKPTGPIVLAGP
jgi:anti-sigma-K factor RskA